MSEPLQSLSDEQAMHICVENHKRHLGFLTEAGILMTSVHAIFPGPTDESYQTTATPIEHCQGPDGSREIIEILAGFLASKGMPVLGFFYRDEIISPGDNPAPDMSFAVTVGSTVEQRKVGIMSEIQWEDGKASGFGDLLVQECTKTELTFDEKLFHPVNFFWRTYLEALRNPSGKYDKNVEMVSLR
jgi:hypothetical protein